MTKSPAKRKSTGKKMRFEIFARDGFRCRYCGRESSEVQLVLDHMTPVCQGGETTPENLITSCFDCNAGKAGHSVEQRVPTDDDRLRREQEMREQEQAYETARKAIETRQQTFQLIVDYMCELYGVDSVSKQTASILASYYREHGEVVFGWMETASRSVSLYAFGKYVSGIRRRCIEEGKI